MKEYERSCGQKPILISDDKQRVIRHVYRAEQLVFSELKHLQRREIQCRGCGRSHQEWFETDEAEALRVIEKVRQYTDEKYGVAEDSGNQIEGNIKWSEGGGTGIANKLSDQQHWIQDNDLRSEGEKAGVVEGRKDLFLKTICSSSSPVSTNPASYVRHLSLIDGGSQEYRTRHFTIPRRPISSL